LSALLCAFLSIYVVGKICGGALCFPLIPSNSTLTELHTIFITDPVEANIKEKWKSLGNSILLLPHDFLTWSMNELLSSAVANEIISPSETVSLLGLAATM